MRHLALSFRCTFQGFPVIRAEPDVVGCRRLPTASCLPAGHSDLPGPRSLPTTPCGLDHSSGARSFLVPPFLAVLPSCSPQTRRLGSTFTELHMAAASVHLLQLVERRGSSGCCVGSVKAVSAAVTWWLTAQDLSIWKMHHI